MSIPDYIKPGAFVRLRDGSKAEIYSIGNGGIYPVHGRILGQDGMAASHIWTDNGTVFHHYHNEPKDIIGPWVVERPDYSKLWPILPPWIRWLAMDADGELFGYQEKQNPGSTGWGTSCAFRYTWIPHDYRPEPVGDWKDSLQERPAS